MGYDCKIMIIDKDTAEKWKSRCPDLSVSELYSEVLWTKTEEVCSLSSRDLLQFSEHLLSLPNDGVYEFTEESWSEFLGNIENKLKEVSCYDLAVYEVSGREEQRCFMYRLITTYSTIKETIEDLSSITILFEHDW